MAYTYLSIFDGGEKVAAEALTLDPASLYCAFEQVTDGRKKKGKRYPLPFSIASWIRSLLLLDEHKRLKNLDKVYFRSFTRYECRYFLCSQMRGNGEAIGARADDKEQYRNMYLAEIFITPPQPC